MLSASLWCKILWCFINLRVKNASLNFKDISVSGRWKWHFLWRVLFTRHEHLIHQWVYIVSIIFQKHNHLSSRVGMQSGNICVFALWIQSSFLCIDGFLRSETWDVGWWYGTTWMLQTVSECDLWTQLLYLFLGRASGVLEKAVFSSLIFEGTLGFIVVGV